MNWFSKLYKKTDSLSNHYWSPSEVEVTISLWVISTTWL